MLEEKEDDGMISWTKLETNGKFNDEVWRQVPQMRQSVRSEFRRGYNNHFYKKSKKNLLANKRSLEKLHDEKIMIIRENDMEKRLF